MRNAPACQLERRTDFYANGSRTAIISTDRSDVGYKRSVSQSTAEGLLYVGEIFAEEKESNIPSLGSETQIINGRGIIFVRHSVRRIGEGFTFTTDTTDHCTDPAIRQLRTIPCGPRRISTRRASNIAMPGTLPPEVATECSST